MSRKKDFNFDLKQIHSFLEVLQEKNFTRASRKLKIGQATISHHIQMLEEMLGLKLIERTSKDFSVTHEGRIFKVFCDSLFDNIEKLKADLAGNTPIGITGVASSTIPSTYILPAVIAGLKKESADYYYRLEISDSREAVEKVKEGVVEVGISGKQLRHPSLTYKRIYSDRIVLIGSSIYADRIAVQDITELPLVGRERGSGTRDAYENALSEYRITPSRHNIVFECSTSEGVKEAVCSGIGVAFISSLAIKKELKLNTLKVVEVEGLNIKRDFFVLYLNNKHLTAPACKLIDALSGLDEEN